MEHWKQEIAEHPVHSEIKSLITELSNEQSYSDPNTDGAIHRLQSVLEKTMKIIDGADERYIPKPALDNISSFMSSAKSNLAALRGFRSNAGGQVTYRDQIENYSGQILMTVGQIRAVAAPISKNSAFEKIGFIRLDAQAKVREIEKSLNAEIESLKESLKEIKDQSSKISESVTEDKARIDNLLVQFQSEFNNGQKERDRSFKNKLEKEFVPSLDAAVDSIRTDFVEMRNEGVKFFYTRKSRLSPLKFG